MRVLVTGAGGRVGAEMIRSLRAEGDWVRGLDMAPARAGAEPDEMIQASLLDADAVTAAVDGVDAVVHLAALMSWLPQDAERLFDINVRGTFNLLQAVTGVPLSRFVFASSGEVYPELNPVYLPIDESHPTNPISVYGMTKLLGEDMLRNFARRAGLPFCIARFSHTQAAAELFDPNSFFSGPRFYVNAKLRQLRTLPASDAAARSIAALEAVATPAEQHYIGCSPDGRPYRMGICDVRDLVQGLMLCLHHPKALGHTYNIGPARACSFDELVPYLARHTGLPIVRVNLYTQPYDYETSAEKARQELGYVPEWDMFRMIDDGARAWQAHPAAMA